MSGRPAIVKVPFSALDDDGMDCVPATAWRLYLWNDGLDPDRLRVIKITQRDGSYALDHDAVVRVPQDLLPHVMSLDGAVVLNKGRTDDAPR